MGDRARPVGVARNLPVYGASLSLKDLSMITGTKSENRLLSASELKLVSASRFPAIKHLTMVGVKALVQRLRRAHNRARDISARQQREMRGKTDPRRTRRARDNTGSKAKVQALFEALQRAERELSRRNDNDTRALSQVEHPRHALKRKLRSQAKENANAKRLASKRMRRVGMSRDRSRLAGRRRDARKD